MGNGIGLAVRARHRDACTEWTYLHWNRHPHRLDSVRLRARGLEEPGSRSTVLAPHLLKNLLLPVAVLVLLACAYADSTVTGDPPCARCQAECNAPNVAGLVYITAFAPDRGESVASLIEDPPPGAPVPPILPPNQGFLALDKAKFAASFAADVAADTAEFMANSQVPWGVEALNGAVTKPAWRSKPSWYLVATDDRMIAPPAQRFMAKRAESSVVEAKGSHAVYVSQPEAVAELIKKAAKSIATK
jgi:pimeloyl-ACP methyl ester carboxylesterase